MESLRKINLTDVLPRPGNKCELEPHVMKNIYYIATGKIPDDETICELNQLTGTFVRILGAVGEEYYKLQKQSTVKDE